MTNALLHSSSGSSQVGGPERSGAICCLRSVDFGVSARPSAKAWIVVMVTGRLAPTSRFRHSDPRTIDGTKTNCAHITVRGTIRTQYNKPGSLPTHSTCCISIRITFAGIEFTIQNTIFRITVQDWGFEVLEI